MPDGIVFDAPSAGGVDYDVRPSADLTALTFTFTDFGVKVGDAEQATLTSTVAWFPLPLSGSGAPVRVDVSVSGSVLCGPAAGATLVFRLSGAQTTIDFPPGADRSFVATLSCSSADVGPQVDAVVLLVARRADWDADPATLTVDAVDAQLVAG